MGPITTRRVLKMSGLNLSIVEPSPAIKRNPMTMITAEIAIIRKFMVESGKRFLFSSSLFVLIGFIVGSWFQDIDRALLVQIAGICVVIGHVLVSK